MSAMSVDELDRIDRISLKSFPCCGSGSCVRGFSVCELSMDNNAMILHAVLYKTIRKLCNVSWIWDGINSVVVSQFAQCSFKVRFCVSWFSAPHSPKDNQVASRDNALFKGDVKQVFPVRTESNSVSTIVKWI